MGPQQAHLDTSTQNEKQTNPVKHFPLKRILLKILRLRSKTIQSWCVCKLCSSFFSNCTSQKGRTQMCRSDIKPYVMSHGAQIPLRDAPPTLWLPCFCSPSKLRIDFSSNQQGFFFMEDVNRGLNIPFYVKVLSEDSCFWIINCTRQLYWKY